LNHTRALGGEPQARYQGGLYQTSDRLATGLISI